MQAEIDRLGVETDGRAGGQGVLLLRRGSLPADGLDGAAAAEPVS